MKPYTLPQWTKCLPDHAVLSTKDVYPIFGYSNKRSVSKGVKAGLVPAPDQQSIQNYMKVKIHQWSLGLLRRHESEQ
jgi:hypothetical protein